MKKLTSLLLLCSTCCIFSCGGNSHDTESYENQAGSTEYGSDNAEEMAGSYQETQTVAERRSAERKNKGDAAAIHYKELQKFLPAEIKGFTARGEKEGGSIDMDDVSYSTASQQYRKGDADLTIMLMDYNDASDMYEGLTGAWDSGMRYEDDNQKTNGVSLLNNTVKGVESFVKKDQRCELMAGISDRFFLQITVNNTSNPSLCKEIAEEMNLRALSAY